jgi:hypothetical protein
MVEYIYYTGVGAKKSGKHTVNEFLNIMNKHFNVQCSEFLPQLEYKPCSEYKEIVRKENQYNMKHNKPLVLRSKSKRYQKLVNKCNKYKKTAKKRPCNLDEYIKFSGAEKEGGN